MIRLTRLNHGPFLLNPDLIEHLETTPDTVITLTNGHQFMVLESAEEVLAQIVAYRRKVGAQCLIARIPEVTHAAEELEAADRAGTGVGRVAAQEEGEES